MSGICGVWAFDGNAGDLNPVLAELERRGPDGTHSWSDGPVALGHTSLATTPEALAEVLPLTDPGSGCTITADIRLDNREELIAAFDLGREGRTIGDGELVLRAYLKWGEQCPAQLLGDFAFAIWDPREQRLFCARDHMGMRQLNYHYAPGKLFAFGTVDTALLAIEAVPGGLNEARIADFITDLEGFDFTSTFFNEIHRVPPAHWVAIANDSCRIERYWAPRAEPPLRLGSDAAYAAAFLAIFTEAVRCRTRTAGGLAAMLSGGLDSTSVVAVAAAVLSARHEGPLTTISAVGRDASSCPETAAIGSALSIEGLDPILVKKDDLGEKGDSLTAAMNDVRNPFEVNGTMLRCIYLTARENGINVVLDGGAGDVVFATDNRIASLLSRRRFRQAWREVCGEINFWKPRRPLEFLVRKLASASWVAAAPRSLRLRWRRYRLSRPPADLAPAFAERVGFADRLKTADSLVGLMGTSEPARRVQSIFHPNLASGRERFDQFAGSFGVESRDPFMDIRLIQFCLSLPAEQLQDGGWPKIILRRAVEALVPQDIAWRRGKEHLGWDFTKALLESWNGWQEGMSDPGSPLNRYVSQRALRDVRNSWNDPSGPTLRLFALDRFLRRYSAQVHGLSSDRGLDLTTEPRY